MRNLIWSLLAIMCFTACENTSEAVVPVDDTQMLTPRAANKVNVCHNGNILNISINAIPDHRGHGDAVDLDGDGYFDLANDCVEGVDCDDTDPDINVDATDVPCNGLDEDCSGGDDESTADTWYADADGDSYGNAGSTLTACTQPEGYVADNTDCDDSNDSRYPGNTEVCGNGIDDNCDGSVDEGCCEAGFDGQPHIVNNGLYWQTANLNIEVADSWCYDNNPANCDTYGRLYSEQAAQTACAQLGTCWRLPTIAEWTALANTYGGMGIVTNGDTYHALIDGGSSGFNAKRGGGYIRGSIFISGFGYYQAAGTTNILFVQAGLPEYDRVELYPSDLNDGGFSCRCVKEVE